MSIAFSSIIVRNAADLEHAVAQIPNLELVDAKGIVLRVDATLWTELVTQIHDAHSLKSCIAAVCKRAPSIDIYVLVDAHSAVESQRAKLVLQAPRILIDGETGSFFFQRVDQDLQVELRKLDLSKVFEAGRTRCVACAGSNYHFELPSGAHASQFLRIGDAFTDIESIDRVAYWIAMEIQSQEVPMKQDERYALLVDHPSMLILAARVQALVSVRLEIVAFPTYPSDVESRVAAVALLRQLAARCSSVFVAIGVASTGRLASFIQQWASDQASAIPVRTFVLYAVEQLPQISGVTVLCSVSLPEYKHYPDSTKCELCKLHSAVVKIQASSYLVGYTPVVPVILGRVFFNLQRDFIREWGQHEGVLRVHYDDPNPSVARHHSFYIDVETLLGIASFREKIVTTARAFQPTPDVVVVPNHAAAIKTGRLVADAIEKPLITLDPILLSKGEGRVEPDLFAARCALIIDDVFITGSNLDSINRFIRQNRATHAPHLERIHYWTVLATIASKTRYEHAKGGMTKNHSWTSTLEHLYEIPLPEWHDASQCPWCMESKVLTSIAQTSSMMDGPIVDRVSSLNMTSLGIVKEPFFVPIQDFQLPNLGAEAVSLPAGVSPMQVLFACASAIQQLRMASTKALDADRFPSPAFLAERNFSTNYTERLIWLGMLRSLKSKELEPALKLFLTAKALDENDGQRPVVHGDLAIAWLTGKLGSIPVSRESIRFFANADISWEALFNNGLVDRAGG